MLNCNEISIEFLIWHGLRWQHTTTRADVLFDYFNACSAGNSCLRQQKRDVIYSMLVTITVQSKAAQRIV